MGNLHCVSNVVAGSVSPIAIPATTETVVATMTAFNENMPGGSGPSLGSTPSLGSQGVYLGGSINLTTAAGVSVATLRVRQGSLTGALVGAAQVVAVAASVTGIALDIGELDPTLVQTPAVYVVTIALTGGTGTVNRVLFTAEDATSFE